MWFWLGVWWCGWFVGCCGGIDKEIWGVWEYGISVGDEVVGNYKIDFIGIRNL